MVPKIIWITRKNCLRVITQDLAERMEFFAERPRTFLHDTALRQFGIELRSDIEVTGTVKRRAVMFVVGIEPWSSNKQKNAGVDGKLFQAFTPIQIERVKRHNTQRQRDK